MMEVCFKMTWYFYRNNWSVIISGTVSGNLRRSQQMMEVCFKMTCYFYNFLLVWNNWSVIIAGTVSGKELIFSDLNTPFNQKQVKLNIYGAHNGVGGGRQGEVQTCSQIQWFCFWQHSHMYQNSIVLLTTVCEN